MRIKHNDTRITRPLNIEHRVLVHVGETRCLATVFDLNSCLSLVPSGPNRGARSSGCSGWWGPRGPLVEFCRPADFHVKYGVWIPTAFR